MNCLNFFWIKCSNKISVFLVWNFFISKKNRNRRFRSEIAKIKNNRKIKNSLYFNFFRLSKICLLFSSPMAQMLHFYKIKRKTQYQSRNTAFDKLITDLTVSALENSVKIQKLSHRWCRFLCGACSLNSCQTDIYTCHTSIEPSITQIFCKVVLCIGNCCWCMCSIKANVLWIFLVCAKHNKNTECIYFRRQNNSQMCIAHRYTIKKTGE